MRQERTCDWSVRSTKAGGENMGCSKVGENQENQVICLQCQDEVVRVCPGSPRSPRRAIATRLSSGSADREPSSSSYNVSSGTFYSCVSQITIAGFDLGGQVAIAFSHWKSPFPASGQNLPSPDCVHSEASAVPPSSEHLEPVSCQCWAPRCLGLALVVILRAVQTPGLVCVAKPTEVRARPPMDLPHNNGDIHPASSPLHLLVVALGEALVT